MSIWGCYSPATYCQPADAAGFIYCRSQEWALHSPSSTGFVYVKSSWTRVPFVFSSILSYTPVTIVVLLYLEYMPGGAPPSLSSGACHTLATVGCLLSKHIGGGGTSPTSSSWIVYLQITWRSAPPPLSSGGFYITATVTSFPAPRFLGRGCHSCLLGPACLFTVCVRECPFPTLRSSWCPTLFAMCLFFQLLIYYSVCLFVFFFPWAGVSLSRGVCWSVPRCTGCCLCAHLVVSVSQAG
jgi:hypothetical protein